MASRNWTAEPDPRCARSSAQYRERMQDPKNRVSPTSGLHLQRQTGACPRIASSTDHYALAPAPDRIQRNDEPSRHGSLRTATRVNDWSALRQKLPMHARRSSPRRTRPAIGDERVSDQAGPHDCVRHARACPAGLPLANEHSSAIGSVAMTSGRVRRRDRIGPRRTALRLGYRVSPPM